MNELQGQMKVAESEVLFDNINSNAMGGKMILNGLFSTKNPTVRATILSMICQKFSFLTLLIL